MKDEFANRTSSFIPYPSYFLPVVPDGVEPSFPGCRLGVVAVGPRDRYEWSHRDSHPDFHPAEVASSCWTMTPRGGRRGTRTHKRRWPPPVFKTGSSSGRMTSVVKLRRLESNQHEDVQSDSSYR